LLRLLISSGFDNPRASIDVARIDLIEQLTECLPIVHVGIQTTREQTTHTKPQLETPRRSASPAGQTSLWRDRNWSAIQWNVKSCKKVTPSAATPCFARTHHSLYRHRTFFGCDLSLDSSNLILFVPSRARLNKRKCTMRRINLRPASAKAVSDYIAAAH